MTKKSKEVARFLECVEAVAPSYTKGKVYELVDCQHRTGEGFIADENLFGIKSVPVSKPRASTKEKFLESEKNH